MTITKKELVEKIAEIYSAVADTKHQLRNLTASLEEVESILEDIPENEADIVDKEPEE